MDERAERRRQRRVREAHFPRLKRLADFDCSVTTIEPATIGLWPRAPTWPPASPSSCSAIRAPEKVTCSSAWASLPANRDSGCATSPAAQLVNELVEAADERRLSRIVARYGRLDLLCLDELGYVQLDARGAELLFQILTEREERASVAIASNLPFSEWGQSFTDPRLVAAIVDRLTFRAHIIETGTDSYRLHATRTTRARKR